MTKKELIFKHRNLVSLGCRLHNLPSRLLRMRVKGKNNRIEAPCALLKQVSIHIVGDNNQVIFEDFSQSRRNIRLVVDKLFRKSDRVRAEFLSYVRKAD